MHPQAGYELAMILVTAGLNDCEVARRTGIPRGTVRDWRHGRGRSARRDASAGAGPCDGRCDAVEGAISRSPAYAYLLGIYLGDGCISAQHRGVFRLRISCLASYPDIIREVAACMAAVRGSGPIGHTKAPGVVEVGSSWKHWPCVFPQHGPGRKHKRRIVLTAWQREIVEAHPRELLRGLIHSDGSRHINTVTRRWTNVVRTYSYPRYMFTNASDDIRRLFTDTCGLVGIRWTRTNVRVVAVSRQRDVAFLDTFVGPKS